VSNITSHEYPKILIIQTAFKGDVILATALVEKLAESDQVKTIDFLVRKGNEDLLSNNPHLNKVWVLDKKQNKYRNVFRLIRKFRHEKYDLVVNIQRYFTTGMITAFSGAKVKVGFNKNPWAWTFNRKIKHKIETEIHEIDRNQSLISFITDNKAKKPKLYPGQQEKEKVKNFINEKFITISPSSVWFTKRYPKEKWIQAMDLFDEGINIYLLGGPDDFDDCEELKINSKHPKVVNLAGELNMIESAALMKYGVMNYVNDSAPMHVASSVNAPTTAIYCSTIPEFGYGPLSDTSRILEVQEKLACRPCGLHGHMACPQKHFKCSEIDPSEIVKSLNRKS